LPIAFACAMAGAAACVFHSPAPGRDLSALAAALGGAAQGARVAPGDVRWESSGGALADLVVGRGLLFLAERPSEDTRDVWRARARVAPDGSVLEIADAHDLTNTPLGDDHALVLRANRAAFATRAYGQEQSVTLLDLAGEGAQNKTAGLAARTMAAITNLQRTGSSAGVGRLDVTFESPGRAVGLDLGEGTLEIALFGGDPRRPPTVTRVSVDLARGELSPSTAAMHADASMHLPKRFSHWTVDTLRTVPWIGPAPLAWVEDQALALRDVYRRFTFSSKGSATDVVSNVEPLPALLDTSQASVDEAHWPPQNVATIWKSSEPGEGEWVVPDVAWLRGDRGAPVDAPSPFYQTFVRPDQDRPYAKVLLVAMDMRQLDLEMEAGVEDPEPLTGPPGAGRIPRDPLVYRRVVAAFNGAFKTEHGHYGMMVHKRVLLPPVPASATVIVLEDGAVGFGTWGSERRVGGIDGVNDDDIVSFRQNLDPLVDHGEINPTGRNLWGFTLPGKGAQTERTGLCVTTSGHLVYAWGDDASATTLASAMKMASCDYAMHLDMNPYHTGFLFTAIEDLAAKKYKSQLLTPAMSIPIDRYIQYAPKDFFYVLAHDPTPPQIEGAPPWKPDGGAQPPPRWLAGVWATRVAQPEGAVDLIDVEPGRATWRIRAGARDASAAAPLRELGSDEAKHVLLAAGMGAASDRHPLGLATDGRLASSLRGGADSGLIVITGEGRLVLDRADSAPALGAHEDLAEVPIILWDGATVSAQTGAVAPRAAVGTTSSGRVFLARGTFASVAPLANALARAGCNRAVSLDRGLRASALLDRAGTDNPLRRHYDETILYAVGSALRPRGFRFEPSTSVVQAAKPK
jgi:hypothetical protein